MTRKEIYSLIILILVISYGIVRYVTREYTETKSQYLLDTIVEISASSKDKNVGEQVDDVFAFIKQMQQKFDEWNPESWISLVNNSTETSFPMDSDAYEMLMIADSLYRFSEGGFDITIKPVFDLWKFDAEDPVVPDSSLIKAALVNTGFSKIKFDKDHIYKPLGMQITFGAIAKGYILDKSKEYMVSKGLSKGFINCRSSMTFFGSQIPQIVYVQHPRKSDDIIASFKLKDLSVGTSGDYQQYFE
ncbi:MAG: FAD:protein FMN transferase, partial [Candidatus Cloacimonetes bacterium HGW-Cloacimonetes-1]